MAPGRTEISRMAMAPDALHDLAEFGAVESLGAGRDSAGVGPFERCLGRVTPARHDLDFIPGGPIARHLQCAALAAAAGRVVIRHPRRRAALHLDARSAARPFARSRLCAFHVCNFARGEQQCPVTQFPANLGERSP